MFQNFVFYIIIMAKKKYPKPSKPLHNIGRRKQLNLWTFCCWVAQSCPTLCDSMDCSTPGLPVFHCFLDFAQSCPSSRWCHLTISFCLPLLLPSIFPRIRIFSNESVLCIRWPKYWTFSFRISPSNEYSGLISFRIEWVDLLVVQGSLKSFL